MQTFLPYADFTESARVLDTKRLGKQRVEALQLLKGQWPNHPASRMWRGHRDALARYMNVMIKEWVRRGYHNTMELWPEGDGLSPWWIGWKLFHYAHRCNLARKSPYYRGLWPETNLVMPYIWPPAEKPHDTSTEVES